VYATEKHSSLVHNFENWAKNGLKIENDIFTFLEILIFFHGKNDIL